MKVISHLDDEEAKHISLRACFYAYDIFVILRHATYPKVIHLSYATSKMHIRSSARQGSPCTSQMHSDGKETGSIDVHSLLCT